MSTKRDRTEKRLDYFDAAAPCRGDTILLVGPDGEPNNLHSHVYTLVSHEEDVYEVTDEFRRTLYITELNEGQWIQVIL